MANGAVTLTHVMFSVLQASWLKDVLLNDKAHIYVCGDSQMSAGVSAAIGQIIGARHSSVYSHRHGAGGSTAAPNGAGDLHVSSHSNVALQGHRGRNAGGTVGVRALS
jgi:hypothetical protein